MLVIIQKNAAVRRWKNRRSAKSARFRSIGFHFLASLVWKKSSTNRNCG